MQRLKKIKRKAITHISVNIGYKCNQVCKHCHLEAGPERNEVMDLKTANKLVEFIKKINPESIEITGGSPELMPDIEKLILDSRSLVGKYSFRTNLTLLNLPKFDHLKSILFNNDIELVASLPCFTEENVDKQRGKNVFRKSIESLKKLNKIGYGLKKNKKLDLVFNPPGFSLPPNQKDLEDTYKAKLQEYGIFFNDLYTLANVLLGRFKKQLIKNNRYKNYIQLLKNNFNENTLDKLMCLNQVTVDWQGNIYDCDFNLADGLPRGGFSNIDNTDINNYLGRKIFAAEHCFACTAGSGSSCHGALND